MTLQFPWHNNHQDILFYLGSTTFFVGGCVRNTLMRLPLTQDWDLATLLTPDQVIQALQGSGYKIIPTGIDHGTVTVVTPHHTYEITTLRRDMATDGRYATVQYTTYLSLDAGRRDFTMNALYLDAQGHVWDYVGGYGDIQTQCVRFIGDAVQRIQEDYLRILRYFRFHSNYGNQWQKDSLQACIALAPGVGEHVSVPRMTKEVRSLLDSRQFWAVYTVMHHHRVWHTIFQVETERKHTYDALHTVEAFLRSQNLVSYIPLLRWFLVGSATLALSWYRWESRFLKKCWHGPASASSKELLMYVLQGQESQDFRVALWIVLAFLSGYTVHTMHQGVTHVRQDQAFPVTGHDIIAMGYTGPAVAKVLQRGKMWWMQSQGRSSKAEILQYLHSVTQSGGTVDSFAEV